MTLAIFSHGATVMDKDDTEGKITSPPCCSNCILPVVFFFFALFSLSEFTIIPLTDFLARAA